MLGCPDVLWCNVAYICCFVMNWVVLLFVVVYGGVLLSVVLDVPDVWRMSVYCGVRALCCGASRCLVVK